MRSAPIFRSLETNLTCRWRRFVPVLSGLTLLLLTPANAVAQPGQAVGLSDNPAKSMAFKWNRVTGSTWYHLWVNDSSGARHTVWYRDHQVRCAEAQTTCEISVAIDLLPGTGTWWVQTYNDTGYGPWSAPRNFFVSGPGSLFAFGHIREDGSIRSQSSAVLSVTRVGAGLYCVAFTSAPSQVQLEGAVVGLSGGGSAPCSRG